MFTRYLGGPRRVIAVVVAVGGFYFLVSFLADLVAKAV
jgi:hypothetical protein